MPKDHPALPYRILRLLLNRLKILPRDPYYIFAFFKSNELPTTDIELKAIAAEAKIGLSRILKGRYKIPIATGIRMILYPKAQKRLSLIVRMVFLDKMMAEATEPKSLLIKVIFPDSIATSVPEPMAIPTSAPASAGASLIPSPTKATFLPSPCNFLTFFSFSPGR